MALTKEERDLYKASALELANNILLNKLLFVLNSECDKMFMTSDFSDSEKHREALVRRQSIEKLRRLINQSIKLEKPPKEGEIQQLERID